MFSLIRISIPQHIQAFVANLVANIFLVLRKNICSHFSVWVAILNFNNQHNKLTGGLWDMEIYAIANCLQQITWKRVSEMYLKVKDTEIIEKKKNI